MDLVEWWIKVRSPPKPVVRETRVAVTQLNIVSLILTSTPTSFLPGAQKRVLPLRRVYRQGGYR